MIEKDHSSTHARLAMSRSTRHATPPCARSTGQTACSSTDTPSRRRCHTCRCGIAWHPGQRVQRDRLHASDPVLEHFDIDGQRRLPVGQNLSVLDVETKRIYDGFCDRTLPKVEWTHEAHLRVCWASLSQLSTTEAIDFLRDGIRAYNLATGVENTPTAGYHETLTVYFVRTVADLGATTIEQVIDAPRVTRAAPLRHWSRDLLFSRAARAEWTEPDLAPLPRSHL